MLGCGEALTRRVELLKGLTHRGDSLSDGDRRRDQRFQVNSRSSRSRMSCLGALQRSRATWVEFRRCRVEPDGRSLRSHVGVKYPSEKSKILLQTVILLVRKERHESRVAVQYLKSRNKAEIRGVLYFIEFDYRRNVSRRSLKTGMTVGKSEFCVFYHKTHYNTLGALARIKIKNKIR